MRKIIFYLGVPPEASRQRKYSLVNLKAILTGLLQGPGYPLVLLVPSEKILPENAKLILTGLWGTASIPHASLVETF